MSPTLVVEELDKVSQLSATLILCGGVYKVFGVRSVSMRTHFLSVFVVSREVLDSGESRDVITTGKKQAYIPNKDCPSTCIN